MRDSLHLQSDGDPELTDTLSPRERQLLIMATNGLTDQGIAHELGISVATVSTYWGRVRIKFGGLPRTELVANFVRSEMSRINFELAVSEARFRTVLEASPSGIALTDAQGTLLYVNPAFEKMIGRSAEELIRDGIASLVHPEDKARVVGIWEKCLKEGASYLSEHRFLKADGQILWVRSKGDSWRSDGEIGGRVSVIEDVTAEHEAEKALIEAESRYRTLLALAPEAIITVNEDLKIVEFNPGAERMFGYCLEEVLDKPLTILIPVNLREKHDGLIRGFGIGTTAAARPMASRSEVCGLRSNGEEFACEASIMRQTVNKAALFTAILRDVSGRSIKSH